MNTKLRKTTCYTQGVESRLRKSLEQFTALNRHRRAVELGEHGKTAFNVKPADIRRPQTLINYMCKSDLPDGEPHEERWQKKLPAFLQSDGLPVRWWGELNAKTPQGRRKPRSRTRLRVPLERLPLAT